MCSFWHGSCPFRCKLQVAVDNVVVRLGSSRYSMIIITVASDHIHPIHFVDLFLLHSWCASQSPSPRSASSQTLQRPCIPWPGFWLVGIWRIMIAPAWVATQKANWFCTFLPNVMGWLYHMLKHQQQQSKRFWISLFLLSLRHDTQTRISFWWSGCSTRMPRSISMISQWSLQCTNWCFRNYWRAQEMMQCLLTFIWSWNGTWWPVVTTVRTFSLHILSGDRIVWSFSLERQKETEQVKAVTPPGMCIPIRTIQPSAQSWPSPNIYSQIPTSWLQTRKCILFHPVHARMK